MHQEFGAHYLELSTICEADIITLTLQMSNTEGNIPRAPSDEHQS